MRVAVTGGTGFIGNHVIRELQRRAISTVALARNPPSEDLSACSQIEWVLADIYSPPSDLFQRLGMPDVLIHLAWGGLSNYRSTDHFETELPAHYRFLKDLTRSGLPSLVVAGTCFEYGFRAGCLSERESASPHLAYPYAKNVLRQHLEFSRMEQAFNLTWARLFYMYGEGQHPQSIYAQLVSAVERGEESFDMSGGEQLRDYLPVEVVASHLVDLAVHHPNSGIVNVCSGRPRSIRAIVEGWVQSMGATIHLNLGHFAYPTYEPMAFWGDESKLVSLLQPRIPTREE